MKARAWADNEVGLRASYNISLNITRKENYIPLKMRL